jgi:tetratricopeptide (TPR) repeat protein
MRDAKQLDAYRAGWRATMQLIREGRSFSGNEPNSAMLNLAGGSFANVAAIMGLNHPDDGRAIGVVDWDHDGDLDLWYANRTGPRLRLMRNQWIDGSSDHERKDYIAFQLQGTQSNRDGIGARVEVVLTPDDESDGRRPPKLVRALRAGEGYLSQSSKILHFGLGTNAQLVHVEVRWPNGLRQRFEGLVPGRRYRLVEGSELAEPLPDRSEATAIRPAAQPAPTVTKGSRTLLATRIPLPILRYHQREGAELTELESAGRVRVILLWASWCPHCLEELAAWQRHQHELQGAGVEVLALNVDGLDATYTSGATTAAQRLAQLQFEHASGFASREAIDKLELLHTLVFNRQPPAAVPMTYLADAEGKLAAIYQGPVELQQLLDDIHALRWSADKWRDHAVPLAGRWTRPPRELLTTAIARFFREAGYGDDYVRYLELDARELEQRIAAARSDSARRGWLDRYAKAHFELGVELLSGDDAPAARDHFARAVAADPAHHDARLNLGVLLAKQGALEEGAAHLQQVLDSDPASLTARINLAAAYETQGRFALATQQYRTLLEQAPEQSALRARLGRALIETGDFPDAVNQFTQVLASDPDDVRSLLCLAWLHATSPDDQVRDGVKAEVYARRIAALNRLDQTLVLDLLAAAEAEQGRFEQALTHVRKAIARVADPQSDLHAMLLRRQALYANQQPYRDEDGKYP